MNTPCPSNNQTVAKPSQRCATARPSIPKTWSSHGLRDISTEFAARTGLTVRLTGEPLTERLPAETELALYRILQVALKNVEQHARANHVTVRLTKPGNMVQLTVKDGLHGERVIVIALDMQREEA